MIPMMKSTTRPHHQIRSMLDKHANHKPRYESYSNHQRDHHQQRHYRL